MIYRPQTPGHTANGRASLDEHMVRAAAEMARDKLAGLPRRWAHTCGVAATAQRLCRPMAPASRAVIVSASWLHDIGYSPALALTGFHPLDGARHLRADGFHSVVVSLVAHHTGADSEAYERGLLAELAEFPYIYRPLLDVLTTADLTTSPHGTPAEPEARIAEILTRYPPEDPVHRAVTYSRPKLLAAVARVRTAAAAVAATSAASNEQRPGR